MKGCPLNITIKHGKEKSCYKDGYWTQLSILNPFVADLYIVFSFSFLSLPLSVSLSLIFIKEEKVGCCIFVNANCPYLQGGTVQSLSPVYTEK